MKDEIKEILDNLKYTAKKHTIQVLENGGKIEHCPQEAITELRLNTYSANILLDYITNLQKEIERLNHECDTYLKIATKRKNIIDELEKWLSFEFYEMGLDVPIDEVLDKLKELKEKKND